MTQLLRLAVISCFWALVLANVEKTIFLGPETANIPSQSPTLDDLNIHILTPHDYSTRTHIQAQFPSSDLPNGLSTWLILDELEVGRRYEARICWIATQPTAFKLNTYTLSKVFDTPDLIGSLYSYSISRKHSDDLDLVPAKSNTQSERQASVLFLHVQAAAEYYSSNKTLMTNVPPVLVDIILDPFLFNVLPRSLLPTVGYILLVVAPLSYLLATMVIMPRIRYLASTTMNDSITEKKVQ